MRVARELVLPSGIQDGAPLLVILPSSFGTAPRVHPNSVVLRNSVGNKDGGVGVQSRECLQRRVLVSSRAKTKLDVIGARGLGLNPRVLPSVSRTCPPPS